MQGSAAQCNAKEVRGGERTIASPLRDRALLVATAALLMLASWGLSLLLTHVQSWFHPTLLLMSFASAIVIIRVVEYALYWAVKLRSYRVFVALGYGLGFALFLLVHAATSDMATFFSVLAGFAGVSIHAENRNRRIEEA